jgi:hypothetical protein
MCRVQWFHAVLRNSFHSPLLNTLFFHPFHQLVFHPPSLNLAIDFLVYLSALLIPNSLTTLFWEFHFLPLCVHTQTNVTYLTLLSLLWWFNRCINFLLVNVLPFSFSLSCTGPTIFKITGFHFLRHTPTKKRLGCKYIGYPESNLRFGVKKKPQVKRNIFYYLNLKATILNYFST